MGGFCGANDPPVIGVIITTLRIENLKIFKLQTLPQFSTTTATPVVTGEILLNCQHNGRITIVHWHNYF